MRIAYDAKRAFNNKRGLGSYSRALLEGIFSHTKEEIFLYTPKIHPLLYSWHNDNKKNYNLSCPKINFPFWRSLCLDTKIKKDNIDIFHGLSNEIPYFFKKPKAKIIVTIHDLIFLKHPDLYPKIDKIIYTRKTKYACKKADHIITISQTSKSDIVNLLKVNEKKISIIPPICKPIFYKRIDKSELQKFLHEKKISQPYFLYLGAFDKRKNIENIIKAFHKSHAFNKSILVLAGNSGDYKKVIQKLIKKLNTNNKVIILDNIKDYHLPFIYQGSLGFIFPSMLEGFGMPIIEAMASKTPVITSNQTHFKDISENNAYFCNPYEVNHIKEKIDLLYKDKKLRKNIINQGESSAKLYHSEKLSSDLIRIYDSII
jgi:glycosyltransferase involved in cell wall biosynthesis